MSETLRQARQTITRNTSTARALYESDPVATHLYRVVWAALVLKLLISVWNAQFHKTTVYDQRHHTWRARAGGLQLDPMAYNPPLYYLPGIVVESFLSDRELMRFFKYVNVVYLAVFYFCWIFRIFPHIAARWHTHFLLSIALLALPGFQKLGAMVTPDVLHAALAAMALACCLELWKVGAVGWSWRSVCGAGVAVGIVGLTRPFAAASVFALWLILVAGFWRYRLAIVHGWMKLTTASVLAAALALSWYAARGVVVGKIGPAYSEKYIDAFADKRVDFDWLHYFVSFDFLELVRAPNRLSSQREPHRLDYESDLQNSFFTLLYSETWGDHWLYFSGPKRKVEAKVWVKRVLFVYALPLTLLLLLGFLATLRRQGRVTGQTVHPRLLLLLYFFFGAALYLWWQAGDGLLPGKNSTIKFTYNAHLFPLGLAVALPPTIRWIPMRVYRTYVMGLFVIAFPMALFWWA